MAMTQAEMDFQLDRFGAHRIAIVAELAHKGTPDGIATPVLLAMGSRESFLQNIVGDGGHGRGWLQVDDRWHPDWLGSHQGCASGSWTPTFSSALPAGRCPTLSAATLFTIAELRHGMATARGLGITRPSRILKFAIAAHNAGEGGATKGFKAGDVDAKTTGKDYSADVWARKKLAANYLKRHPVKH